MSASTTVEEPRGAIGFIDLIYRRRAVRAYQPNAIEERRLHALLEAAVHAPTAMHQEPWQFVVVQDRALLENKSRGRGDSGRAMGGAARKREKAGAPA